MVLRRIIKVTSKFQVTILSTARETASERNSPEDAEGINKEETLAL